MLQNQLNRQKLLQAAKKIIHSLDPKDEWDKEVFQRGLELFRKGCVYNVISELDTIEANVNDDHDVHYVFINLHDADHFTCDCYPAFYCEHVIATLLYCGSVTGGMGDMLDFWKGKERLGNALLHVKKASDLLQTDEGKKQNISNWYDHFQKVYENMAHYDKYFVLQHLYERLIEDSPRISGLWELYQVNALMFTAEKLIVGDTLSFLPPDYVIRHWIDRHIEELVHEIDPSIHTSIDNKEQYLEVTKNQVIRLLELSSNKEFLSQAFLIYQIVWSRHLQRDHLVEEHMATVEKELARGVRSTQFHYELAHLYFLTGQDEKVKEQLGIIGVYDFQIILAWLGELAFIEKWGRMEEWLTFASDCLQKGNGTPEDIQQFLEVYRILSFRLNIGGYEQCLQALLPHSFYPYSDYLLEHKDFTRWASLHMLLNHNPFIDKQDVKLVEKHERTVLIPLYHHHIAQHIQERNRNHYKAAVSLLKKLRAIYRKEKKADVWEDYLAKLTTNHARLRAFLEEMRKGKIIS